MAVVKIVVLDGFALNPGDLSWDALRAMGELQVFDRSDDDQVVARAQDAEIVLTNKTRLSAQVLRQLKKIRYIGVLATGYDVVDVDAARERKVPFTARQLAPANGRDRSISVSGKRPWSSWPEKRSD
jgi:glycerate dehydrogenase